MFTYDGNEGQSFMEIDNIVKRYNEKRPGIRNNQLKILLIGQSIAEGITLKDTDFIHIFSIPSSIAKLRQIIARVYRNCTRPDNEPIIPYLYLLTNITRDAAGTVSTHTTTHRYASVATTITHCTNRLDNSHIATPPEKYPGTPTLWAEFDAFQVEDDHLNHDINKITEMHKNYYDLIPYLEILKKNAIDVDPAGSSLYL